MRRITWHVVCWCILTTFRTDKLLVTVCFFSSFWRNFDSLKQVEFGGYGHFFENTGMAWNLACWCILIIFRTKVTVCWFFSLWQHFDLVKQVKFGVSGHFVKKTWEEGPEIGHADVSWPPSFCYIFVYVCNFCYIRSAAQCLSDSMNINPEPGCFFSPH